jgi:outer membrane receptor protein involved in Fe transport
MRSGTTRLDRFSWSPIRAALAFAILAYLPAWPALAQSAQAADAVATFNIPAGDLAGALDRLSTQTGIQLMYQPGVVAGKQAKTLSGRMTWQEALGRLLQDSGLEYGRVNATTIVIRRSGEGAKRDARPAAAPSSNKSAASEEAPVMDMKGMTVTGTRIRGGTTPSPVITIGAENIREEGFTDLGEVIRSVPQNFSGGQNPGVFMGNVTSGGLANQNVTGGSALNLRGLGPDASLTLLNGRRLSYGGFVQAVDISAIPTEAVERIEIIADGASAIYGSDAVGGVGNVILKQDFDGVTVGARYGTATEGGLTTREYNATAGTTWSTGGLIATYKEASTDPIYASQRDYADHLPVPSMIYPGGDLHSALFSAHQALGDAIELRLDALRTRRTQTYSYFGSPSIYSHIASNTTTTLISPSIEFTLPHEWSFTVSSTWGEDRRILHHDMVNALTGVPTPYLYNCHCDKSRTSEIGAEGPLFALPGGDARLAAGVGYRSNGYAYPNYLTGLLPIDANESVRFGYAELNLPLIGNGPGGQESTRLALTAAVRRESYDSLGGVTTPKIGVIYNFNSDFTFKASWGRSFKAPTLFQRFNPTNAVIIAPSAFGATGYAPDEALLYLSGGNPNLKPERARTLSGSLAFHPEAVPELEAELTAFKIDYQDRVVQPNSSLNDPRYAEFVDYSPSIETVQQLVASSNAFYNYLGQPYDSSRVVLILNGRYVNATQQNIEGVDLTGSYNFDVGGGQLTLRGSTSWLESTQKTPGALYAYDLAGTINNPAKINGRLGAVWHNRGFSASIFGNFTGGVTDTVNNAKGASFTTFDTTLGYSLGVRSDPWSGVELSLSVTNLLDRHPPLYQPTGLLYVAPYDSANYSAIGRYVNLSVSKHW